MTTTESGPEADTRLGEVLLETRDVSKFSPGVRALKGVDFALYTGEVHALVGENGAGKSTLMKILSGLYQPGGDEILMRGEPITLPTPFAAQRAGISVIHQEFLLMNHLTAVQNMFISREPRPPGGLFDHGKLDNDAAEPLERLGVKIDPRIQVGKLTVASQQLLEITRALSFNSKVLVMDEPTATFNNAGVETLFRITDGFIGPDTGIVYISRRMGEVRRKSTRITVLRDGKFVDSRPSSEVTIPKIIQLMMGHKLTSDVRPEPRESIEMVLDVKELSTAELLRDVNFRLEEGRILGFAGLIGAGCTEVARALTSVDPRTDDVVTVGGRQVDIHSPKDAVRVGIGYLSKDHKHYGPVLQQDVATNAMLPSLKEFSTGGLLQDGRIHKTARK